MNNNTTLRFGLGNSKLSLAISTFSLPAGYACPFAKECLSKANRLTGKIIDGQHCRFRCFSASQECVYPNVRRARWHNFNLILKLKTIERMAEIIQNSLPRGMSVFRVHVSGDFFNERYFLAWLNVAYNNPSMTFYGYTKATPLLVKYRKYIPSNFRFTASRGGTHDHLIKEYNLRYAEVVFSVEEAEEKGLEIDHDDSLAFGGKDSFALLLHGTQPPGSDASRAWRKLVKSGIGGYSDTKPRMHTKSTPTLQMYVTIKNGKIFIPAGKKNLIYA